MENVSQCRHDNIRKPTKETNGSDRGNDHRKLTILGTAHVRVLPFGMAAEDSHGDRRVVLWIQSWAWDPPARRVSHSDESLPRRRESRIDLFQKVIDRGGHFIFGRQPNDQKRRVVNWIVVVVVVVVVCPCFPFSGQVSRFRRRLMVLWVSAILTRCPGVRSFRR